MARDAFSDLHGRLDLFNKIIDFIQPDDIVYCLGDCGAVNSGIVALINLDTYEIHKIYGSEWD